MRRLVPVALLALAVSPAIAQTQYADSAGVYVSLIDVSVGRVGSFEGEAGVRLPGGVDLGLALRTSAGNGFRSFRAGPVVGITRAVGSGFIARATATAQYVAFSHTARASNTGLFVDPYDYSVSEIREDVSATLGRRIPIVGSVAFQPAIGAYAVALQRIKIDRPSAALPVEGEDYSLGVQFEIPITFRMFGLDAAIAPVTRFSLRGSPYLEQTTPGVGYRLNF